MQVWLLNRFPKTLRDKPEWCRQAGRATGWADKLRRCTAHTHTHPTPPLPPPKKKQSRREEDEEKEQPKRRGRRALKGEGGWAAG